MPTGSTANFPASAGMSVQCSITGPAGGYTVTMSAAGVSGTVTGSDPKVMTNAVQAAIASLWSLVAMASQSSGGIPAYGSTRLQRDAFIAFTVAQQDYQNAGGT